MPSRPNSSRSVRGKMRRSSKRLWLPTHRTTGVKKLLPGRGVPIVHQRQSRAPRSDAGLGPGHGRLIERSFTSESGTSFFPGWTCLNSTAARVWCARVWREPAGGARKARAAPTRRRSPQTVSLPDPPDIQTSELQIVCPDEAASQFPRRANTKSVPSRKRRSAQGEGGSPSTVSRSAPLSRHASQATTRRGARALRRSVARLHDRRARGQGTPPRP